MALRLARALLRLRSPYSACRRRTGAREEHCAPLVNSRRVQPDGIHVSISSTAAAYLFKRRRTSSSRSTQRRRGAEAGCRGGAPRRRAEAAGRGGVPRRRAAHRGGTGRGRGCCSCGGEPAVVARRHGCSGPARRRWHDRTRANALSSLAVAHSRVPRPASACWPFPCRGTPRCEM